MKAQERKAFRPTTVKNNILNSVRAIRGTRKQIEQFKNAGKRTDQPGGLESFESNLIKELRKFWNERKANGWNN